VSVAVTPSAATLAPGAKQQFSATVLNTTNTAVTWSVDGFFNGNTTVGTISTSGLYTAPATNGTHNVVATSVADTTKSDTAIVTVTSSGGGGGGTCSPASGPPSVTICSPAAGATVTSPVQIAAVGNSSTTITKMLVYIDSVLQFQTTTSSSINISLSVANGTHNLTVQFYNGVWIKQSENFMVGSGSPIRVSISPASATVAPNDTQQFTASVTGSSNTAVNWSVDGVPGGNSTAGTVNAAGLYNAPSTSGTHLVTATSQASSSASASATVTVAPPGTINPVNHVIFLMQENRSFDTYFGMLNPYRKAHNLNVGDDGNTYNVDGIDDKLSTTNVDDQGTSFPLFHTVSSCLDDMTSSWLESYGDISRYDFSPRRSILMDGFVHTAEGFAKSGSGSGEFTDLTGQRAMAYYQDTSVSGAPELNYYYYMASQFALSDRWFSPFSSKSTPNRIATLTGGTTQGLVRDPFADDKLTTTLGTRTIFQELDSASPTVSWKIYYTLTEGGCNETSGLCGSKTNPSLFPVTTFSDFGYSGKYLYGNASQAPCQPPTVGSQQAVGDSTNAFCIDPTHIAPLSQFFKDLTNGTLPNFAYIEAGYGINDEHPGSGQSILTGQVQIAKILNSFMNSPSWTDSVFFLSYDEGGGPYDHVPPVPGHSNDNTNLANMGFLPATSIPDISTIAVNADSFIPCLANGPVDSNGNPTPTAHCDLKPSDPGAVLTDAPAVQGFAAQLGFRLPNMVISPFTRKHYVSHVPMDHTAVIKFVETRFIGPSAHLTNRDAAQPNLLDFFDFTNIPWLTPPAASSVPVPPVVGATCTPRTMQ
jgi:phospholipase C